MFFMHRVQCKHSLRTHLYREFECERDVGRLGLPALVSVNMSLS